MRRQCQQYLTDQSQGRIAKNRPTKILAGWKPTTYQPTKSREKKSADFWCHTTIFLSSLADKTSVVWHRLNIAKICITFLDGTYRRVVIQKLQLMRACNECVNFLTIKWPPALSIHSNEQWTLYVNYIVYLWWYEIKCKLTRVNVHVKLVCWSQKITTSTYRFSCRISTEGRECVDTSMIASWPWHLHDIVETRAHS